MPRPVILFSGQWTDLPLEELAQKAAEWGYQGLELCCWGDHFEVQRALSDPDYCPQKLDLLARYELSVPVLSNPVAQGNTSFFVNLSKGVNAANREQTDRNERKSYERSIR